MTTEELAKLKASCTSIIAAVEAGTIDDPCIKSALLMLGGNPRTVNELTSPHGNQASLLLYFTALLGRRITEG